MKKNEKHSIEGDKQHTINYSGYEINEISHNKNDYVPGSLNLFHPQQVRHLFFMRESSSSSVIASIHLRLALTVCQRRRPRNGMAIPRNGTQNIHIATFQPSVL